MMYNPEKKEQTVQYRENTKKLGELRINSASMVQASVLHVSSPATGFGYKTCYPLLLLLVFSWDLFTRKISNITSLLNSAYIKITIWSLKGFKIVNITKSFMFASACKVLKQKLC